MSENRLRGARAAPQWIPLPGANSLLQLLLLLPAVGDATTGS